MKNFYFAVFVIFITSISNRTLAGDNIVLIIDSAIYPNLAIAGDPPLPTDWDVTNAVESERTRDTVQDITFYLQPHAVGDKNLSFYSKESTEADAQPYLLCVTASNPDGIMLAPDADAYVGSTTTNNKGGDATIKTFAANDTKESFIRFDLSSINEPITNAKLVLWANSPNPGGIKLSYIKEYDWDEMVITWENSRDIPTEINEDPTAISNIKNDPPFVYPTLTDGSFTVKASGKVIIMNMGGVIVHTQDVTGSAVINTNKSLASGLYFVKVKTSGGVIKTDKVVIR